MTYGNFGYTQIGGRFEFIFNEMHLKCCLYFAFVNNFGQIRYQPNPKL